MSTPTVNVFEQATRQKLRFSTPKGQLTTEDLFDLPLLSVRGNPVSIDSVGTDIEAQIQAAETTSFVQTRENKAKATLQLKREILGIIRDEMIEADRAKKDRAKNAEKRRVLQDLLDRKQTEKLEGMSEEEILAQMSALGDEA